MGSDLLERRIWTASGTSPTWRLWVKVDSNLSRALFSSLGRKRSNSFETEFSNSAFSTPSSRWALFFLHCETEF